MTERANATFSRTSGLFITINPAQTDQFFHARVSDGTVRYSEFVPAQVTGEQASWRIPIHELLRITAGLEGDALVTISDGQPQLHLSGAGIKAKIPLIVDLDFLAWEVADPKTLTVVPEFFANIHAVEWAATTRPGSQSNLTAVHITPTLIAATDRYSMAFAEPDYPESLGSGLVSAQALRSLPKLGYQVMAAFTDRELIIQCSPYAQAAVTLVADKPLDFKSLLEKRPTPDARVRFEARHLIAALRRGSTLTNDTRQLDVTFSVDKGISIIAGDPDATIAQFDVDAEVTGTTRAYTLRVNADNLLGALREAKGEALIAFDPAAEYSALHLKTSRSRVILMPVRASR